MQKLIYLTLLALPVTLTSQSSLKIHNHFSVVSSGVHAVTGTNYPWPPTTPPGYQQAAGVAKGTRIWSYTPPERFTGGHADNSGRTMFTITGLTQRIHLGAAIANPLGTEYLFAQGIAAAQPKGNIFEHSATGPDLFMVPSAPVAFLAGQTLTRASVALTTPIVVPTKDAAGRTVQFLAFAEYKGGEYLDSLTTGQCLGCDWYGGAGDPTEGDYAGYTVGTNPRVNTYKSGMTNWRPQTGWVVDEPLIAVTGFHGNQYYSGNPMALERYRGVNAAFSDWGSNASGNSSIWFDFSCGATFAGGTASVLMNISPTRFPIFIPLGLMGNLQLNPSDPMLTVWPSAGYSVVLDGMGEETSGSTAPIILPVLASQIGLLWQFQGIVIDTTFTSIRLTNSSSVRVLN